jgi:hypothetical protein
MEPCRSHNSDSRLDARLFDFSVYRQEQVVRGYLQGGQRAGGRRHLDHGLICDATNETSEIDMLCCDNKAGVCKHCEQK